ncbi:MAG TPA: HEAT repeat domain-containing protein [Pirellulales bacterium]|nr:HEAT repeat domain-containing protein [Pirellulales bacterium]
MSAPTVPSNDEGQVVPERARRILREVLAEATEADLFHESADLLLRKLRSVGESLAPALGEALHYVDSKQCLLVAWMLMKLAEKPTPGFHQPQSLARAQRLLAAALEGNDETLKLYACVQLANGGVPDGAVPALTSLLDRREPELTVYAAAALSWCGEAAAPAIPCLTKALVQDDELLATVAANALARLGVRRKDAAQALVQRLSETPSSFRLSLLLALRDVGPLAADAATLLENIAANASTKSVTRAAAAEALGSVAPNQRSRQFLLKLLHDPDGVVVQGALDGLHRAGQIPPEATDVLRTLLRSTVAAQRRAAAHGLGLLGDRAAAALPELIEALCQETDPELIGGLARACAQMGTLAVRPLCDVLQQGNMQRTGAVTTALLMLGRSAAEEIAKGLSTGQNEFACWTSVGLLRALGKEAEPAIPALAALLPSLNDERALYVLSAIANYGAGATAAIPAVIQCLLERNGEVSEIAGKLLQLFGNAAIPELESQLASATPEGRQRIEHALKRIRPHVQRTYERLLTLGADRDLLLFGFAAPIIHGGEPIGLRKVSKQLAAMEEVDRLNLPTSEASLREMFATLEQGLQVTLTEQTTKGTKLTAAGIALLSEAADYLRWRGLMP